MKRPLSDRATILLALVVVGVMAWRASREGSIDWTLDQVGPTIRMVERNVEIADAAKAAKDGPWGFLSLPADSPEKARRRGVQVYYRAIDRLEELARPREARTLRAHLAFLLANSGRTVESNRERAILERAPEPCGFCEAMRSTATDSSRDTALPPRSLEPLRPGWAATRLEIQLLEAAGDKLEVARRRTVAERSARARLRHLVALELAAAALLYVGVLSLVFEARYAAWRPRIAATSPVAVWAWNHGIGVFVRSEFVGLVLTAIFVSYGCGGPASIVCLWASLFWFLPLLWLARRHLAGGPWQRFGEGFRLLPSSLTHAQVVRTALGLLTLIWLGGAALDAFFSYLGTDADLSALYFDPTLTDTPPRVFLASVNAVLFAPFAEELTFRGLVYLTLRQIVRPPVAAVASAALFAEAHLYSLTAALPLFWTGLVLAFGIERYRTLLPGLLGHAVGNLFFVVSNIVTYR